MVGDEVEANQKSPTTSDIAPTIIGGSRSSGSNLPLLSALECNVVKV